MLARLDAPTRERLLAGVEEARPGLSTSLRRKMLRFEDLGELGVSELQRFFSQFPPQRWALALRGAEESLVKKLLAVLPARASQGILEERELMGPRPLRDVQLARQEICEKAQSLGLLPLPSGSDRSGGSGKSDQGSQGG
jgi:flagellar motor switch protein FliG